MSQEQRRLRILTEHNPDGTHSQKAANTLMLLLPETLVLTGQSADNPATNVPSTNTAGMYRVSYYIETTRADVLAGTVTATLAWTDGAGATTQASSALSLAVLGRTSGVFTVHNASGYITGATSHTGSYGSSLYSLYVAVERMI